MSIRLFTGCSRRCAFPGSGVRRSGRQIYQRNHATASRPPPTNALNVTTPAAAMSEMSDELDKLAPRFDINASQIKILESPSEFFSVLKAKILSAKDHVFLSTLYIGKDEHELIDALRQSLRANPALRLSILTDYLRGNRETPAASCATLLLPLIQEFPDRVDVRMYHTPNLTGLRKRVIPKRLNEGWGLQHMKLYGFDDEILLSGANLSNDYFTNRQDRYHLFSSREITTYFRSIFEAVSDISFRLMPNDASPGGLELLWPSNSICPSPLEDPDTYRKKATSLLSMLIQPTTSAHRPRATDTSVYPVSQFTPLMTPDSSTELPAMKLVLRALSRPAMANSSWTFTAGYFNMTPEIRNLLLATRPARGTVVAASPWANGFYGSKGVSGMLPAAYTYLSRRFLGAVRAAGLSDTVRLKEWRLGTVNTPGGWTYHAKGLWVTLPGDLNPSVTLVGSSNYTKRSYSLDLESNALIVTRDPELQRRLGEEEKWLQTHAREVDENEFERTERRVGLHVRVSMWIVKMLGGAL